MLKKPSLLIWATLFLIGLSAWSPWLTLSFAETRAVEAFDRAWTGVIDGCGTNCKGCGAVHSERVPFGVRVTLEYGCGLMPADTSQYHERTTVFVSALGTVHGFPKPSSKQSSAGAPSPGRKTTYN